MNLTILFQHQVTDENCVTESVVCAEFNNHLHTIIKRDESNIIEDECCSKYKYFADGYYASSNSDIDITEALKEHLGLENNTRIIDPDFYFDHD